MELWWLVLLLAGLLIYLSWLLIKEDPRQHKLNERLATLSSGINTQDSAQPLQLFRTLDVRGIRLIWQRLQLLLGDKGRSIVLVVWCISMLFIPLLLRGWGVLGVVASFLTVAFLLPWLLLRWLERRRIQQFEARFPVALELISRAISAGSALPQAFEHVAKSETGPVGDEFRRLVERQQIGIPMADLLKELAWRVPSLRLRYFVVAVTLNMESGGQLAEVLNRLGRSMQQHKTMQQKIKTLTAEPRMAARIVAIIPLGMFLGFSVINPQAFDFLLNDPVGQKILSYVVSSILIGLAIVNLMTRI